MLRPHALILLALLAPAALAAAPGSDKGGALIAYFVLPMLAVPVQFLFAALFPQAVRRLARATSCHTEATVAWGAGALVLLLAVGGLLGSAGGAIGQGLAGLVGAVGWLVALAGGSGFALLAGRWSLRRDGCEVAPTALAVPLGSVILAAAMWVPLAGQLLGLALLVLSLGAAVRATVGVPRLRLEEPAPPPQIAEGEAEA